MDKLTKLAIKHKTDKWGKHNYTPFYYDLFKDKVKEVKKVVEIGAGEGAGLRMFRDFFPNAQIYGGEIDNNRLFTEDRITVFKCNQTNEMDLASLIIETGMDIDLFIDDGSHKPEDQIFTCLVIMPYLVKDSIYVIEDVSDPDIIKKLSKYDCKVVEFSERYDDRIIVVKHK